MSAPAISSRWATGLYGGRFDPDTTFRIYGFESHRGSLEQADGASARDGWSKGQGGFRGDWSTETNNVTVQGDFYRGTENQLGTGDLLILGGNVVSRYQHHEANSDIQVQFFYDMSERSSPTDGTGFVVHTFDLEVQQAISLGRFNRIVWGGGERVYTYDIANSATLLFEPPSRTLTLSDGFLQDTLALGSDINLIVGVKMEDDPFWGWTPLPDARLAWTIRGNTTVWAAASRAIRSPTPFDDEVVEKVGTTNFLVANGGFRPEKVTAYEVGVRSQPSSRFSLSISPFYNVYDDLRTVDPAPAPLFLPLYWGNSLKGDVFGLDAWASWQVNEWWRLSPGVAWVRERLSFKPGAIPLLGTAQNADDPSSHATLTSSMSLGHHVNFDATLRYVGALPNPAQGHYYDMDARISWDLTRKIELSLRGSNLLHERHTEFAVPNGEEITRSAFAQLRVRF